jgi:phosphatidylinositol alpha-1,6-mannosyltransferase
VHFPGQLSDDEMADAYASSTIYAGLSRLDNGVNVEGFGISLVEAAASGLVAVAGDSGGVRSAVRDGETGLVVSASSVEDAADAISRLLAQPELRATMSVAARKAVETHYNWERVAVETRNFVRNCIAAGPAARAGAD